MKYLEDAAYVVLLAALMPLLIVFVWAALISIIARRTYWWTQGHSTSLTRRRAGRRRLLAKLWSWLRGRVPSRVPDAANDLFPAAARQQSQDEPAPSPVR